MASQGHGEQHQNLLATHRRTLAHLIHQAAAYGGEIFAPLRVHAGRWQVKRGGLWVAAKPDPGAQRQPLLTASCRRMSR